MFGSDWPVVTTASALTWWIETLKWCVADCTIDEKRRLFHDNAAKFYRLTRANESMI
jgi:L-fuconolactonase